MSDCGDGDGAGAGDEPWWRLRGSDGAGIPTWALPCGGRCPDPAAERPRWTEIDNVDLTATRYSIPVTCSGQLPALLVLVVRVEGCEFELSLLPPL